MAGCLYREHGDDEVMRSSRSTAGPTSVGAEIRETHTGIVILLGGRAYKLKKPVVTNLLDFSTPELRERACAREVALNSRISGDSYVGVSHLVDPDGGPGEPVVVMRRYPDAARLSAMVKSSRVTKAQLDEIAEVLAAFHKRADRSPSIDEIGALDAVVDRWEDTLASLERFVGTVLPADDVRLVRKLATQFISGRAVLFAQRVADRRIVDGHGDLLASDIFCLPNGPVLLDCLEFDDRLRHVDALDDAAFLAMDLEFLGRRDLGDYFMDRYVELSVDPAPEPLRHFYIAYRALVRAKVDCQRFLQGQRAASGRAARHLGMALDHLGSATVRLVLVGGGPGMGKSALAQRVSEDIGAQIISTDEVRQQLHRLGVISGGKGVLDTGLYSPENVGIVYDAVLRRARLCLASGHTVILDGTWRGARHRLRAHQLAYEAGAPVVEFLCMAPLIAAQHRMAARHDGVSDVTGDIAAALGTEFNGWSEAHVIDARLPLDRSTAEVEELCRRALYAPVPCQSR
ncbi:AAA family ATPase [Mycobacterium sp. NPDC050853]|uniref:bifunctional aminoglycoside phosphotransferase/ATP-binding protein n=1 Tax=Mycobacterium sp. NPDC050853 TaxID=3155160 RepID=UPI003400C9FF